MDVGQRHRLEHAEAAGLGGRGDQLGVGAGVHRAADDRHLDPGVAGEGGVERGAAGLDPAGLAGRGFPARRSPGVRRDAQPPAATFRAGSAAAGTAGRQQPARRDLGHHVAGLVADEGLGAVLDPLGDLGGAAVALGHQPAARLLEVLGGEPDDDAAHARRQPAQRRQPRGHLAQVDQRHGVYRAQVVAHPVAVAQLDADVAGLELEHPGAQGAGVGRRAADDPGEQPLAAGQAAQPPPVAHQLLAGRGVVVAHGG